jgi:tryptophanyl-tRNA synthetase
MRAVTDAGPVEKNSPVSEPISNLFTIMSVVSKPETLQYFKDAYSDCSIRYGDLKKQLAEDIITFVAPIRERILEISSDSEYLRKVVKMGKEKAHASASQTIKDVRELIGIRPF